MMEQLMNQEKLFSHSMKSKITALLLVACLTSCVKVETKGAAHEAGDLIRDGVKGGIELYKESKKNDTIPQKDTVGFWDKTRSTIKEVKKTIKEIKE